jgi:eukaryotic-like serine/threonine-protein kinase
VVLGGLVLFAAFYKYIPTRRFAPALSATPESSPSPRAAFTATAAPAWTASSPPLSLSPTPALGVGSQQVAPQDGMVQMYVPEGDFRMGTSDTDTQTYLQLYWGSDLGWFADERPQHTVTLGAFWIDRTEVTNAMFATFVAASGYRTDAELEGDGWIFDLAAERWLQTTGADWRHPHGPGSGLDGLEAHPVVLVSWNDARAYCAWARRRLPLEAEWEKAARGTDGRIYPWGNQPPAGDLANFADKNLPLDWPAWSDASVDDGYEFTSPAGQFPSGASPYGVLDMAGNVWEWVNDWYAADTYATSPGATPLGPVSGSDKVLRGGSWYDRANFLRSADRYFNLPDYRGVNFGFRCAVSP